MATSVVTVSQPVMLLPRIHSFVIKLPIATSSLSMAIIDRIIVTYMLIVKGAASLAQERRSGLLSTKCLRRFGEGDCGGFVLGTAAACASLTVTQKILHSSNTQLHRHGCPRRRIPRQFPGDSCSRAREHMPLARTHAPYCPSSPEKRGVPRSDVSPRFHQKAHNGRVASCCRTRERSEAVPAGNMMGARTAANQRSIVSWNCSHRQQQRGRITCSLQSRPPCARKAGAQ